MDATTRISPASPPQNAPLLAAPWVIAGENSATDWQASGDNPCRRAMQRCLRSSSGVGGVGAAARWRTPAAAQQPLRPALRRPTASGALRHAVACRAQQQQQQQQQGGGGGGSPPATATSGAAAAAAAPPAAAVAGTAEGAAATNGRTSSSSSATITEDQQPEQSQQQQPQQPRQPRRVPTTPRPGSPAAPLPTVPRAPSPAQQHQLLQQQQQQAAAQQAQQQARQDGASCSIVSNAGALERGDFAKFVQFFRQASPYIEGHRARTFVVVLPGEVVGSADLVAALMSDIALLHGLGSRLVVVLGAAPQIDAGIEERGSARRFVGGYRVTCAAALEAAVEAAGRSRTAVEQFLSRGPSVPAFRRHAKGEKEEMHFGPALSVVSGNYVAAKRRGIIDGVDFGFTGEVRFVARDAIRRQLEAGNIVVLSNLGFTAAGEVLNCNTYDVGLHAAVELSADKLICLHLDDVSELALPAWLPLSQARHMLLQRLMGHVSTSSIDADEADRLRRQLLGEAAAAAAREASAAAAGFVGGGFGSMSPGTSADGSGSSGGRSSGSGSSSNGSNGSSREALLDLDLWTDTGFPTAVAVAVVACAKGVRRAHLVDARLDGGVLLELYSRDGVGTMISTDFYEGIRRARGTDLEAIEGLLEPLTRAGVLVRRAPEELRAQLPNFTVIEREAKVMGCALLLPLGASPDGARVAEIGAFCVDVVFRGTGRGDSLLDYVEQDARNRGVDRLVLLTTRTADWFVQRDFKLAGPAWSSELLPAARRARINPARNSQLYYKALVPLGERDRAEPGSRIGF